MNRWGSELGIAQLTSRSAEFTVISGTASTSAGDSVALETLTSVLTRDWSAPLSSLNTVSPYDPV